jgi:TetR/AcrR family transcriptional regulator, tetracycline repressor protein
VERRRLPGQRAGLSRKRVLAAAHELLAEGRLEALTMRALAERLEVSPNALYSHVESKTALIDDLLDELLAQVDAPSPDVEDPSAGLHALMASTHAVLLSHPDMVPLYLARQGARGPNARRLGDVMLELLARTGVTGPKAREALRVLIVYTIGFAAFVTRGPIEPDGDPEPPAEELLENFDAGLRWLIEAITGSAPGSGTAGIG